MKKISSILLLTTKLTLASMPSITEVKLTGGLKEFIAGSYFQNFSIVGHGTNPRDYYEYIRTELSQNPNYSIHSFEDSHCTYEFFTQTRADGALNIVLLPFQHKETKTYFEHTFDKHTKLFFDDTVCGRDKTLYCLEQLKSRFSEKLRCHLLISETSQKEGGWTPQLTTLGKIVQQFVHPDESSGHLNYACVEMSGGTQTLNIYEPESLKVESRYFVNPTEFKRQRYEGLDSFDVNFIYRGDQCYNMHDCGRFSAIYLMLALEDRSVERLSRFEIYQGFKRFIENKNGLLSFQKDSTNISILCKEYEIKSANEKNRIALEAESFSQKSNIKKMLIERRSEELLSRAATDKKSMNEKHLVISQQLANVDLKSSDIEERLKAIKELQEEYKSLQKANELYYQSEQSAITEEQNQLLKDRELFIESLSMMTLATKKDLFDLQLKTNKVFNESPPIKKTWMAFVTTIGRKSADFILGLF